MATRDEKLAALRALEQGEGPSREDKLSALSADPGISTAPAGVAGQAEGSVTTPEQRQADRSRTLSGLGVAAEETSIGAAATAGAIGGSKLGAALPVPPMARPVTSALGGILGAAIAGGTVGFGANAVEQMVQDPTTPPDFKIAWEEAKITGREEGFFETVGRAITQAAPGGVKLMLNTINPKFDMERLEISRWLQDQGTKLGLIEDRSKAGLTLGKLTGSRRTQDVENLFEDSPFSGSYFEELADNNDAILKQINDKALKNINPASINRMDDLSLGHLVVDAVNNGETMMFHIGKRMYGDLDKMIPGKDKVVTRTVEIPGTSGIGGGGKPLTREIREVVQVGPVNTRPMKDWAASKEDAFLIEKTQIGQRLLKDIMRLDSDASFSRIHELRSAVRARRRDLKGVPDAQNARGLLQESEDQLTKTLDKAAAESTADPQALRRLKRAQKFWREGNEKLNNALLEKVMRQEETPEKLGAALFKANNLSSMKKVREAVEFAGKLGTKARRVGGEVKNQFGDVVNPIDAKDIWSKVQGSYVQRLLEVKDDVLASSKIIKIFDDPEKKTVFREMLNPTQRAPFERFVKTMKIRARTSQNKRSMLAWRENSAVINLVTTAGGAAAGTSAIGGTSGGVIGAAATAGTLIVGSRALARMMTRPEGLQLLGRAADAVPTSQEAGAIAMRIQNMVREIENELGESVEPEGEEVEFGESDIPQVRGRAGPM